jgi:hypothetical protein
VAFGIVAGGIGGIGLILVGLAKLKPRKAYDGTSEPQRIFHARRCFLVFEGLAFVVASAIGGLTAIGIVSINHASNLALLAVLFIAFVAPVPVALAFPGIMGNRY